MLTYVATILLVILLAILAVLVVKLHYAIPESSIRNSISAAVCKLVAECPDARCVREILNKVVFEGYCSGVVSSVKCVQDLCRIDVRLICRGIEESFSFACRIGVAR